MTETSSSTRKSPHLKTEDSPGAATPQSANSTSANPGTPPDNMSPLTVEAADTIASPFKRHRASAAGLESSVFGQLGASTTTAFPPSIASTILKSPEDTTPSQTTTSSQDAEQRDVKVESDEEL